MDETTLTQEPYLCKCWMRRGQQKQIPYPAGSRWAIHLFGGYNVRDDSIAWTLAANRDSAGFIAWLEHLMLDVYPHESVCLVLDNASFHRSAAVKAAVSLFEERLKLFFLPAHSPELNPIELYWKDTKRQVHGNRLCVDQAELIQRLQRHLDRQNDLNSPNRYHVCN